MATITLSASEFQDRVGEALDRSLKQPVLITKHGRPRNVVLSYDEYERLRARDRRPVWAEDLTDEDIAALEASEMGRDTSISTPNSGRNDPRAEGRLAALL
jgi:prevent-host-death family protein